MEYFCHTAARVLKPYFHDFGWEQVAYSTALAVSTGCTVAGYKLLKSPKFVGGLCAPLSKNVMGTQIMATCMVPAVHSALKLAENFMGTSMPQDEMDIIKGISENISAGALLSMFGSTTAMLMENCYASWQVHYDGNAKGTTNSRLMIALVILAVCAFNPPFSAIVLLIWFLQGLHVFLFLNAEKENNRKHMTPYEVLAESIHIEKQERRQSITLHIIFISFVSITVSTGFYLQFGHLFEATNFNEWAFFFPMIAVLELHFLFRKMREEPCQPALFTVLCNKFPGLTRLL